MSPNFNSETLAERRRRTYEQMTATAALTVVRLLAGSTWLFGRYILESEQNGRDQAKYGARSLKTLSAALHSRIGPGFTVPSLNRCGASTCNTGVAAASEFADSARDFHNQKCYPTPSPILPTLPSEPPPAAQNRQMPAATFATTSEALTAESIESRDIPQTPHFAA